MEGGGGVPGGFLWCWARLEGHVAKHQISGPAGLGGVFLNKRTVRFSSPELLRAAERCRKTAPKGGKGRDTDPTNKETVPKNIGMSCAKLPWR